MSKRINSVCRCSAYDFPHRLTGGKCTGSAWAEDYYYNNHRACSNCNCNNRESSGNYCEVAQGLESIYECQALEES